MGMVKTELKENATAPVAGPQPALPSFTGLGGIASQAITPAPTKVTVKQALEGRDLQITKGGVAHDAATITAAMCAMKSDSEVMELFAKLFNHILATVTQ